MQMTQMTTNSGDVDPEEENTGSTASSSGQEGSGDTSSTSNSSNDLEAEVEKWKRLARKHEDEVKTLRPKAKRLDEVEAGSASDLERAVSAAREEERTSVTQALTQRLVRAEIRAAAGTRFNDPGDAVAYLGTDATEFLDENGEVDTKAVGRAIDRLLRDKPYLAPQKQKPPDYDGGGRSSGGSSDPATVMGNLIRSRAGQ